MMQSNNTELNNPPLGWLKGVFKVCTIFCYEMTKMQEAKEEALFQH
jgi:hypothetical protein